MHTIIMGTEVPREYIFSIIRIQVRDGAAKITIKPDSFVNRYNVLAGGASYPIEQVNADVNMLINSFEAAMKAPADTF